MKQKEEIKERCPMCNKRGLVGLYEEIDIGMGIQKHLIGYECHACDEPLIPICDSCQVMEGKEHKEWSDNI